MMKAFSKRLFSLFAITIVTALLGCASPGQKFIDLTFQKPLNINQSGTVGIEPFTDNRKGTGPGYVGHRILLDNDQETFFVQGLDVGKSVTKVTRGYFKNCGFKTVDIEFDHTPEGVRKAPADVQYLVAGRINALECAAVKRTGRTDVTIDIDLTLFLGDRKNNTLQTIPVALKLERVEVSFDRDKVETLLNETLEEVLLKALPFDDV